MGLLFRDAAVRDHLSFVPAGSAVLADGKFTDYLPCLPNEPACGPDGRNQVRAPDGLHFCPDRARCTGRRNARSMPRAPSVSARHWPRVSCRRLPSRPESFLGRFGRLWFIHLGYSWCTGKPTVDR